MFAIADSMIVNVKEIIGNFQVSISFEKIKDNFFYGRGNVRIYLNSQIADIDYTDDFCKDKMFNIDCDTVIYATIENLIKVHDWCILHTPKENNQE
jgi:hypothetical protein